MTKKFAIVLSVSACAVILFSYFAVRLVRARSQAKLSSCVCALECIEGCKRQWALEHHASSEALVTWEQLHAYYQHPDWPLHCPSGGAYTLGRIGETASCSIPAHTTYFRKLH
jgi:hypothetical protein